MVFTLLTIKHPKINNMGGQRPSCDYLRVNKTNEVIIITSPLALRITFISVCLYNHFQP